MTMEVRKRYGTSLTQGLAVKAQVHLPGTVGRLVSQLRDIERVAPVFLEAGLVKRVPRPRTLDLRASGIATGALLRPALGGFLYGAAAVRVDVLVESNVLSTSGVDSVSELDDIDFENQSKRLQLVGIRQAYQLASKAIRDVPGLQLLFLDAPLLLDRSMVPPLDSAGDVGYIQAYRATAEAIRGFWSEHRDSLFPWKQDGPIVVGLASRRFGAIVQLAQNDLRTEAGRSQLLASDLVRLEALASLGANERAIQGVGESRFLHGILDAYCRTAIFKMKAHSPRMEPAEVADLGVLGFHFRAGQGGGVRLAQMVGDAPGWTGERVDRMCGQMMALTALPKSDASPIPVQLAQQELTALEPFLKYFRGQVGQELKTRSIEDAWLSDLSDEE